MRRGFVVMVLILIGVGTTAAQERKITRAQLPAAVERTVTVQSGGATIRGFAEEQENGQTFYELELTVAGHTKDVLMDRRGRVVEVEEEVALDALPAPVRTALLAKAGAGKIETVESLTKKGTLVAYEAHVVTNGKQSEIQVGPDGKPLAAEQ